MSRTFPVLTLLALVMLAWIVLPAYSTTLTTYTDLASWQAATSGVQTDTFETLTPGTPITYYNTSAGVTQNGVQFIGYSSVGSPYLAAIDTTYAAWAAYYNFNTGVALSQLMDRATNPSPLPYIHVIFGTPVTAFGANLFTGGPNALNFTVTVLGTQFTAPTNNRPTPGFWGVTSDTPISEADFTVQGTVYNGGTRAFIDNLQFGAAQGPPPPPPPEEQPEAATMLMIGSGLVGLVYLRKRFRRVRLA